MIFGTFCPMDSKIQYHETREIQTAVSEREKEISSKWLRILVEKLSTMIPLGNSDAAIPQADVKARFLMGEQKP